jgi:hypothetical protein
MKPQTRRMKSYAVSLPTVLYGCKIWSLVLRGEYRLRELEKDMDIRGKKEPQGEHYAMRSFIISPFARN